MKYDQAEAFYKQALSIKRQLYGDFHPSNHHSKQPFCRGSYQRTAKKSSATRASTCHSTADIWRKEEKGGGGGGEQHEPYGEW